MLSLFGKFTSGAPEIRKFPSGSGNESYLNMSIANRTFRSRYPLWVRFRKGEYKFKGSHTWPQIGSQRQEVTKTKGKVLYSVGPWSAYTADKNKLPFKIAEGGKILRSPDRKQGLADVTRETFRIKEFRLSDAIVYSYFRDMRFVLLTCLLMGFSLWWFYVPEQLLEKPAALCSPDLGQVVRVVRDTFVNQISSNHHVSSPCDCGEPLNNTAKLLFEPQESFDPLGLNTNRLKALSVFVASIVLSLALAESVSPSGFRWS